MNNINLGLKWLFGLAFCLFLWAAPALGFPSDSQSNQADVRKLSGVQVPMRDGKFLTADIILPSGKDKYPTIFIHTPYKRENAASPLPDSPFLAELLERENYAYVITDWRGFFGSKRAGVGIRKPNHGQDGYDVIDWIVEQPWSNGRVGLWGHSAVGAVQFKIAAEKHPNLVCAVPASANLGLRYEQFYYGGVLEKHYSKIIQGVGFRKLSIVERHPRYNWFWKLIEKKQDPAKLDLPMLFITGWYDTHPQLKINTFRNIQKLGKKHYREMKLIIGPWHHAAFGQRKQGALEFPEAEGYTSRETLRFFDYHLRNQKDNGWNKEPPIRYFQMGTNVWKQAQTWPPPTKNRRYYLRAAGGLSETRPGKGRADVFRYDPRDPTPTIGGSSIVQLKGVRTLAGPQDLRSKVESRKDVLLYTSKVLPKALALTGTAKAELYLSSDRPDTDIALRLSDVYPDGRSMLITDGIWRMRFRESLEKEKLMIPGDVYKVVVPFVVSSHTFHKGHRIRLSVSSANYPRFDANSNVGERRFLGKKLLTATNSIYHEPGYESVLLLPLKRELMSYSD